MTDTDRIVFGVLEAVEIACRKSIGKPDPAAAIAMALAEHRELLMRLLERG